MCIYLYTIYIFLCVCVCVHMAALHEHKIRDVSCGMAHTLVLSDEGVVFAWGSGSDGQLGVGMSLPPPKERRTCPPAFPRLKSLCVIVCVCVCVLHTHTYK